MNISASQSQLLRQLNIKPLQARAVFFPESVSQTDTPITDAVKLRQPDDCLLSTDIKHLLAQTVISDWLVDPGTSQCMLSENGSVLLTPELNALQQPALKQQLWALLQQQLTDHAD